MKKAAKSLQVILGIGLFWAAFFVPTVYAQNSPTILLSQGQVTATTSQSNGGAGTATYSIFIPKGYLGSISSVLLSVATVKSGFTYTVEIDQASTTTWGTSSVDGLCSFDSATTSFNSPFLQLTNKNFESGLGCSIGINENLRIILSIPTDINNPTNGIYFYYGSLTNNKNWQWCYPSNQYSDCVTGGGSNVSTFYPYFTLLSNGWSLTASSTTSGFDLSGSEAYCNAQFASSTGFGAGIANGLCIALGFLFIPSQASITQFSSLPDNLSNRFPISWFADFNHLIGSFSTTSTATYPTEGYDFGTSTVLTPIFGATTTLSIATPNTIQALASDTVWSNIRLVMGYILWVTFAYFVYHKVRHIFMRTI